MMLAQKMTTTSYALYQCLSCSIIFSSVYVDILHRPWYCPACAAGIEAREKRRRRWKT